MIPLRVEPYACPGGAVKNSYLHVHLYFCQSSTIYPLRILGCEESTESFLQYHTVAL